MKGSDHSTSILKVVLVLGMSWKIVPGLPSGDMFEREGSKADRV